MVRWWDDGHRTNGGCDIASGPDDIALIGAVGLAGNRRGLFTSRIGSGIDLVCCPEKIKEKTGTVRQMP